MQANECRFGNLIKYGGSITQLDTKEMVHFFRFPESYEPIPLTEEWRLKFGFEESIYVKSVFIKNDFSISLTENGFIVNQIYNSREYMYVHQLQNIYFDLKGEELTIKQ